MRRPLPRSTRQRVRLVRANGDKPHRCPQCHRIPDDVRRIGRAQYWRTYWCSVCYVRWYIGWHD